jgi:hypothetical protein
MQIVLTAAALLAFLLTGKWREALGFLALMELFSLYGAAWGARVRQFGEARPSAGISLRRWGGA